MSNVLGINLNTHDSGAAIIKNGKIVAAVAEERFSRIKLDKNPPYLSIDWVINESKISPSEIDIVAISDMPWGWKRNGLFLWQQLQRVFYTKGGYIRSFLTLKSFDLWRFRSQIGLNSFIHSFRVKQNTEKIISDLRSKGFKGEVRMVAHDRAHAAGAYFTSGFNQAFVAVIEGSSFTNSCSFWVGEENSLTKVEEVLLPHSPGRYYEVATLILGFKPKRHEGKITGLAAKGDPIVCYKKVEDLLFLENGEIRVGPALYNLHDEYFARGKRLPKRFENERPEDIAAAFQKRLEDILVEKFKILAQKYNLKHVVLTGGVCANVKVNMEISELPFIKEVFIHPGMGDMGQALGSALETYSLKHPEFTPITLEHVYFGPEYTDTEIEKTLKDFSVEYTKKTTIANDIGELLSKNKVVAVFQGRMEYGPRALGNRTIMYPATDPAVNDWLNKQLHRTEFMPFAPVTLADDAEMCYENLGKKLRASEFMTITSKVTSYMATHSPAAVHVDNTARPQLIRRKTNPVYYDALAAYKKITGIPTAINTSFNMHEEPIVCSPHDAVRAFLASNIDALAIGNFLVTNKSRP